MFGAATACNLAYCAYDDVARGYGGEGYQISKATEDISKVIAKAQGIAKGGKPVLINALIGKSNFREGSLSV